MHINLYLLYAFYFSRNWKFTFVFRVFSWTLVLLYSKALLILAMIELGCLEKALIWIDSDKCESQFLHHIQFQCVAKFQWCLEIKIIHFSDKWFWWCCSFLKYNTIWKENIFTHSLHAIEMMVIMLVIYSKRVVDFCFASTIRWMI